MDRVRVAGETPRSKKLKVVCDCGCGSELYRYRNQVRAKSFVNPAHRGAWETRQYLKELCGPYLQLVTEYLEGPAKQRYRDVPTVRKAICPFFRYLCEHGTPSIEEVNSETITRYLVWAREGAYASAASDVSPLSTFFQWLVYTERYTGESPVIPSFHGRKKKARSGRPYSTQEMVEIRALLGKRGNERLRAFFEIAAESGMRKSEICGLQLDDVCFENKSLTVRLPNKAMKERRAFVSQEALKFVREWLAVRNKNCGHNFLFHNCYGAPLLWNSIQEEFRRALCKSFKGQTRNSEGLDSFSVHRLRHTLASNLASNGADANTIMAVLGWTSRASVDGYTRIDENTKALGFETIMNRVMERSGEHCERKVISLDELLLQREQVA